MKSQIKTVIKKFKEKKIGNLLVKHSRDQKKKGMPMMMNSGKQIKDNFSILTKKDFLLYVLRNYKPHTPEKNYLNIKIKEINLDIIISENKVKKIKEDVPLIEAIEMLKRDQISLLPVIDSDNMYKGFINKSMIFLIFKHELYSYLNQPIREFLLYIKDNHIFSEVFLESLRFTPDDSFVRILKKFVFNYAQLLWVDEGRLKGVISLHDIFNVFLE